jgi:hypothetical protein
METRRFPGMEEFRPEPPKISDDAIALKIATAIFNDVNIEDCYWEPDEAESIINQMAEMIISRESVTCLFWHLKRKQEPISCSGERPVFPWGYEGVQNYPESMLSVIAAGVLEQEYNEYVIKYGVPGVKVDEGTSDDANVRNT